MGKHRIIMTAGLFSAGLALTAAGLASLSADVAYEGLAVGNHWLLAEIDLGNIRIGHARKTEGPTFRSGKRFAHPWFGTLSFFTGHNRYKWRYTVLTVPLWTIVSGLFAFPAVAFLRGPLRRKRRKTRNQCIHCGYSLTGNVTGSCPECGVSFRLGRHAH